tara:strand:- start:22 stop:288 length:267 start_codon:yes stop_codon:yes gene_type:complete
MNIYKLRYESKEEALKDLMEKEVIDNDGNYINGTQAVVECGIITLVYATETEAAIFAEGYHYDIMTSDNIAFDSEIFVNNPKFKFAGE